MSDPLSLVPFAVAAGGGSINGFATLALISAGVTLLQRSAPLVRSLSGRRAALLLPPGAWYPVAWAASDGRAAVVMHPDMSAATVAQIVAEANIGAVFTITPFASRMPEDCTVVVLDDVPRSATVISPGRTHTVDLGSHHGLEITGSRDVEGATDVWAVEYGPDGAMREFSHRTTLAAARHICTESALTPVDHVAVLVPHCTVDIAQRFVMAPLLMGARVTFLDWQHRSDVSHHTLQELGVTRLAASASVVDAQLNGGASGQPAEGSLRSVWRITAV